jgi:hypothetical protein
MGAAYGNSFDPRSLSPALWLSDTGSNPGQWDDISGNNRHATQATPENRPEIVENVQNGRQVRRFDGVNDLMLIDMSASFSQPVTIFCVVKNNINPANINGRIIHSSSSIDSETNLFLPIALNVGGSHIWNFGTDTTTAVSFGSNMQILCVNANGASSSTIRNGVSIFTGNPGLNALARYVSIGGRYHDGLRNFNGDIAEILVFPTALSTSDRKSVENYLAKKWGLGFNPLSLSPALWLSDTGSNPGQWDDISGNNRHATQATPENRPEIIPNGLGGRQVRRFDGVNDQLSGSRILSTSNFSAFVVLKAVPQNAKAILAQRSSALNIGRTEILSCSDIGSFNSPRVFFNNGTSYNLNATGVMLDNTPKIVHVKSTTTGTTSVGINGGIEEVLLTGQTWTPENANYTIGTILGLSTRFFVGDIAEILVFPSALSDTDRREVERYLAQKWNIIT